MAISPYMHVPIIECHEPLVDLSLYGIVCSPEYFHRGISQDAVIYVRRSVAEKLLKVQSRLSNMALLVWDGFRSREIQNTLYQKFWDETMLVHPDWNEEMIYKEVGKFVSPATDRSRIPPHVTGGAVDLTLVDASGNSIEMGTLFDDFSDKAATKAVDISQEAQRNRQILLSAMEAEGFVNYPDEWWHFSYGDQLAAFLAGETHAIYGEILHSS